MRKKKRSNQERNNKTTGTETRAWSKIVTTFFQGQTVEHWTFEEGEKLDRDTLADVSQASGSVRNDGVRRGARGAYSWDKFKHVQ